MADSSSFAAFARQVQELLNTWQRQQIDFLVNNAGIGIHATLEQTTEQQFDTLFNIHLKGVFFLTQQLLPLIRDGGSILNLSSGLTRFALPGYAAYAAMKGGVEVLTRYLAKELGPRGIAVNVVAPGPSRPTLAGCGAGQSGRQRLHRQSDRPGTGGPAGRHRWRDCRPALP